jgi:hypothetical protein
MISGNFARSLFVDLRTQATQATNATFSHSASSIRSGVKYNYVVVDCIHNAAAATDASVVWASIRLESSADGTNWTTVPGCQGTTGTPSETQFKINAHNDTTNRSVTRIAADLRGRGHLFRILAQPPASTNHHGIAMLANLYLPDVEPNTVTEQGVVNYGVSVPG